MAYETYTPLFSEICKKVNNAKDKGAKIKVLREHRTKALEQFMKAALCPEIEWMLPAGDVPFMANDAPEGTDHGRGSQGEGLRHDLHRQVASRRPAAASAHSARLR